MNLDYSAIPDELKKTPQWVCWGAPNKSLKCPYNPATGYPAKAGKPDTWTTFETACQAVQRGEYKGIGFEFASGGVVGVDLDHCIENGVLSSEALETVSRLNSYTEISQSGTGLHILCKGSLPGKAIKTDKIELYDQGRYFALTGKPYGENKPLRDAQEAINLLYGKLSSQRTKPTEKPTRRETSGLSLNDSDIIDVAGRAQNGAQFVDLYAGQWQNRYKSQSEADIAFCNMLAFYTGKDAEQMDRIFRSSGLMREKWDRKQAGSTYGAITIQNAIGRCDKVYNPRPSAAQDFQAISLQDGKIDNDYRGKRLTIELTSIVLQELHIEVRYNIILKRMEVSGLPDEYSKENAPNTLPFFLIDYFKQKGITGASYANVSGYLSCIADKNRYNPVEEFIAQGEWDGVDRVKETCDMIGISNPQHCTYVKKWLIQCVAMALNGDETPVGADGVLVLQGEQGIAKTSFFRKISSCPQWFVEGAVIDMKNKDSLINATSGWICELGELDSTISREQSALKAFITSPWDNIRMPYAKEATRSPRRTSFCGTVNPEKYLRDETGSRRFWTIPVTQIDTEKLFSLKTEWIHQLWLQAYALYEQDHNGFRLSREEMKSVQAENQKFNIPLRYETEIREMLEYELPVESWEWYTSSEIANRLPGNPDSKVVGKALKKVVQELETVFYPVPPLPPKLSKPLHGTTQYFIPLKRFQVYRVEQVEEGRNRIS